MVFVFLNVHVAVSIETWFFSFHFCSFQNALCHFLMTLFCSIILHQCTTLMQCNKSGSALSFSTYGEYPFTVNYHKDSLIKDPRPKSQNGGTKTNNKYQTTASRERPERTVGSRNNVLAGILITLVNQKVEACPSIVNTLLGKLNIDVVQKRDNMYDKCTSKTNQVSVEKTMGQVLIVVCWWCTAAEPVPPTYIFFCLGSLSLFSLLSSLFSLFSFLFSLFSFLSRFNNFNHYFNLAIIEIVWC